MYLNKNNPIVLCLSLFAIVGLAGSVTLAQTQDANPVTEIVTLLQKHDQALNQKDLDALMSLYATGETTVLMGTGPGEKWVGKEEIGDAYKHFFQDFDKGSLTHDCFSKTGASNGNGPAESSLATASRRSSEFCEKLLRS